MKRTEDILSKLLLQNNDDWEIENVVCDDSVEEIRITLKYRHSTIKVDGNEFPILDFRHERSWRHLDMWQYKTVLEAKIPRYCDGGKVKSVPVPWALPHRHGGRFAKRPYFFHLRHISGTSNTGEVMSRSKSQSAMQRGVTPNMLPPKVTITI